MLGRKKRAFLFEAFNKTLGHHFRVSYGTAKFVRIPEKTPSKSLHGSGTSDCIRRYLKAPPSKTYYLSSPNLIIAENEWLEEDPLLGERVGLSSMLGLQGG